MLLFFCIFLFTGLANASNKCLVIENNYLNFKYVNTCWEFANLEKTQFNDVNVMCKYNRNKHFSDNTNEKACPFLQTQTINGERQTERNSMVNSQIVARGISHEATIAAMKRVERHKLVPLEQRQFAYQDRPLPIGYNQTISQPYIVAYMTEVLNPQKGQKVLEIGTGSGYQAAVLAEIVDEVYTIEIVKELGIRAKNDLKKMGYTNIHFKIGDGYAGWEEHAPYDAIIVTAAPDHIPEKLIEQLKDGGRMIIPVGPAYLNQQLRLIEKRNGKISQTNVMGVRFVPFTRNIND